MNRQTLIWLGIGIAVAVAVYYVTKKPTNGALNASGGIPAPERHAFSGTVNQDGTNLFQGADGQLIRLRSTMNRGDRVTWFGQANGMLKIDCDGIWVDQECVTADPEYRNFMGKLEPTQDLLTGKIF